MSIMEFSWFNNYEMRIDVYHSTSLTMGRKCKYGTAEFRQKI